MSRPDQEVLRNKSIAEVIERMFTEAYRKGSKGIAYEVSNLLLRDWGFELNKIQVPTKFWHGEEDKNVPFQWAESMMREIRQASLKKYLDEGHLIIFKHAEEIFIDLTL